MAKKNIKDILSSTNRRKRRRKLLIVKIIFFLVLFLLIVGFVVFNICSDRFRLKQVVINGVQSEEKDILENEVRMALQGNTFLFIPKDSVFFFDEHSFEENLNVKFQNLQNIKVEKNFPQTLTISAEVRRAHSLYCVETCYVVDSKGFIFEESTVASTSDIFLTYIDHSKSSSTNPVGSYFMEKDIFNSLNQLIAKLLNKNLNVEVVNIESGDHFNLILDTKSYIKINPKKSFDETYQDIMTVLSQATSTYEYIDVRFDRKMFYK